MITPLSSSAAAAAAANGRRYVLTIRTAARLLDSGWVTASQLASFCHSMALAGERVWKLHAYNHLVDPEILKQEAQASDDRRQSGATLSVLDGIPLSLKSNLAHRSFPLTAGSKILGWQAETDTDAETSLPCGYDADVVRILLREKGGLCVGLTSMDEFGMGSLGTNVPATDGNSRGSRAAKNPLPLLRHLRLDDYDCDNAQESSSTSILVGTHQTGSILHDRSHDERWAEIVRLSPQTILDKHREALDAFESEQHEHNHQQHWHYASGGSSSGSAVSVAHGSSLVALGTDTGGSVRLPAAWCGLVGFKPTYGLFSRHGVVSYASSLDTVGVLANSVDCVASCVDMLAQKQTQNDQSVSRDPTACGYPEDHEPAEIAMAHSAHDSQPLAGIRVGIPAAFSVTECPPELRSSWAQAASDLEAQGAEIVTISTTEISPDLVQTALSAYYVLVSAEASSNLSRYDGFRYGVAAKDWNEEDDGDDETNNITTEDEAKLTPLEKQFAASRRQGFGPEVQKRILCGASVLSSDKFHTHYEAAATLRARLAQELSSVLEHKADALLIPTVLSMPPPLENPNNDSSSNNNSSDTNSNSNANNTAMFANDVMTVPASLAGLPAISLPVPIAGEDTFWGGMQLISSRLNESVLLKSARALQA